MEKSQELVTLLEHIHGIPSNAEFQKIARGLGIEPSAHSAVMMTTKQLAMSCSEDIRKEMILSLKHPSSGHVKKSTEVLYRSWLAISMGVVRS
jgi:hypothetical protein